MQKTERQLDEMIRCVPQVRKQARERVLGGNTRASNKIVSVFEPQTEVIRKGQASKPPEFGKMVKIQEAENRIVTHGEVFDLRPSDSDILISSVTKHQELLGRSLGVIADNVINIGSFLAKPPAPAKSSAILRPFRQTT